MTYHKSKPTSQQKTFSEDQKKEALKIIVGELSKTEDLKKSAFERVDDAMVRIISADITFTYYLLSLTVACIAFAISLTVNEKFTTTEFMLILALICWIFSFLFSLQSLQTDKEAIANFNYYIIGEI